MTAARSLVCYKKGIAPNKNYLYCGNVQHTARGYLAYEAAGYKCDKAACWGSDGKWQLGQKGLKCTSSATRRRRYTQAGSDYPSGCHISTVIKLKGVFVSQFTTTVTATFKDTVVKSVYANGRPVTGSQVKITQIKSVDEASSFFGGGRRAESVSDEVDVSFLLYTGLNHNEAAYAGIVEQLAAHLVNKGERGFRAAFNEAIRAAEGTAVITRVTVLSEPYIVDPSMNNDKVNMAVTGAVAAVIVIMIVCCIVLSCRIKESTTVIYPQYKDPELNALRDKCVKKVVLAEEREYREKRKHEHEALLQMAEFGGSGAVPSMGGTLVSPGRSRGGSMGGSPRATVDV